MAKAKQAQPAKLNLNEYLATHSRQRNIDDTIVKWYNRKYAQNTKRTKIEWDTIIRKFYAEK